MLLNAGLSQPFPARAPPRCLCCSSSAGISCRTARCRSCRSLMSVGPVQDPSERGLSCAWRRSLSFLGSSHGVPSSAMQLSTTRAGFTGGGSAHTNRSVTYLPHTRLSAALTFSWGSVLGLALRTHASLSCVHKLSSDSALHGDIPTQQSQLGAFSMPCSRAGVARGSLAFPSLPPFRSFFLFLPNGPTCIFLPRGPKPEVGPH